MARFAQMVKNITDALLEQEKAVEEWHINEVDNIENDDPFLFLVLSQHLMNYKLWHVEDVARRKDVDSKVIADCKRSIDTYNQKRNDFMEKIDSYLSKILTDVLPQNSEDVYNSETVAMIIDRSSILSLKIYHMKEESIRKNASKEHRSRCLEKVHSLENQRILLHKALHELLKEYSLGKKKPYIYLQHKMYNDPSLNPELYNNDKQ
ncbi:MAG: DUF4254 domain-containing protein [Desulfovibrionaceae bacterium]